MTVLEKLLTAARSHPDWGPLIEQRREQTTPCVGAEWGRKGHSHYKDGVFTRK